MEWPKNIKTKQKTYLTQISIDRQNEELRIISLNVLLQKMEM